MSTAQRRAATEQHELAIAAINEMFDRADELASARGRLTGIKPLGPADDPIRDAETLLAYAALLNDTLVRLRAAALVAGAHRNRTDLAADLGTKPTVLFPRPVRHRGEAPLTLEPRSAASVSLDQEAS